MNRVKFISGCSLLALLLPAAAAAQETRQTPAPAPAPVQANEQVQPSEAGIADIIVTAQRRSENVQASSLAIDVVTGAELVKAGVSRTEDLTRLVPGLQLVQNGPVAQPYIRGVGNASNTGLNDSGVAFNVDGVNIAQPNSYGLFFYDVARIEVLKGPQGTLYGRNATGGAVNLITNEPGREFSGYVTAEYGNYNNKRLTGALNAPLGDDLAARVAFNVVDRDGYFRDGTGDDVQQAARLRVKYSPAGFTWLVNLEYDHAGGFGGGSAVIDGNLDGNPANGLEFNLVNPWSGAGSPYNLATYNVARDKTRPQFQDVKSFMASSSLDIDLGSDLTLTLIPAYRRVTQRSATYSGGFRFEAIDYKWHQYTMEGRIARQTDNWKWVVGAFYYKQNIDSIGEVDLQNIPPGVLPPQLGTGVRVFPLELKSTESYAIFGETTYSLTDQFRVIGGARYTYDKTGATGNQTFFEIPLGVCSATAPCVIPFKTGITAKDVSWKVGAEWDVGPQSMLFATASRGFKAGGVFSANPPRNNFRPEKVLAFEVGSRNRFLNNRLQVNLEAFYWKYTDKQETYRGFDSCGGPVCTPPLQNGISTNLTQNAGAARVYGGSADIVFRATPTTTLHTNVELANSRYTSFTYQTPPPAPTTGCVQTPPPAGGLYFTVDCSGFALTRAPKWTASADFQQVFPIGAANVTFGAAMTYTSSRYINALFLGDDLAPPYAVFSADLTYNAPGDRLSITGYIKNIGNEAAAISSQTLVGTTRPTASLAFLAPPRTYGVRATFKF